MRTRKAHTRLGPGAIGTIFLVKPPSADIRGVRVLAIALLGVLAATLIHSELGATALLAARRQSVAAFRR